VGGPLAPLQGGVGGGRESELAQQLLLDSDFPIGKAALDDAVLRSRAQGPAVTAVGRVAVQL
jgi:hypothetical protein